jgi:hypothetical protein
MEQSQRALKSWVLRTMGTRATARSPAVRQVLADGNRPAGLHKAGCHWLGQVERATDKMGDKQKRKASH